VNFNSPICEWTLTIYGEYKVATYDFFRDILIVISDDGQHYATDILKTSLSYTLQHWWGFVSSGFRLLQGNLLFGVPEVIDKFVEAIGSGTLDSKLSPSRGVETVAAMRELVNTMNNS
jgi:hypothetical protein